MADAQPRKKRISDDAGYQRAKLKVRSATGYPRQGKSVAEYANQLVVNGNTFTVGTTYSLPATAFVSSPVEEFYKWLVMEGLRGEVRHIEISDNGGWGPSGMLMVEVVRRPEVWEVPADRYVNEYVHERKVWGIASAHRDEAQQCWWVELLHGRPPIRLRIPDELRPTLVEPVVPKTRTDKRVEDVPVAQRKNFLFPYSGSEIADSIQKQIDAEQADLAKVEAVDLTALKGVYDDEESVTEGIESKKTAITSKIARLQKEAAPYRKAADQSFDLDIDDIEHFGLADVDAEPAAVA